MRIFIYIYMRSSSGEASRPVRNDMHNPSSKQGPIVVVPLSLSRA